MFPVSEQYNRSVRSGGQETVTCAAYFNGAVIPGAASLPITGGSVTDSSGPGVRRTLTLELAPVSGLADLLEPNGLQLKPMSVRRFPDGTTETVPLGVFVIDSVSRGYGANGSIRIEASDKWVFIQRAKFLVPVASTVGLPVTQQIVVLLQGVLSADSVTVNVSSGATMGPLVWDDDRAKAIEDLAESIGAWVYYDRNGVPVIDPLPATTNAPAAWLVDASANGVLLEADRAKDRSKTYSVVVVNSEKVDGTTLFDPVVVADNNPSSPTYVNGPFGNVAYKYSSPLLQTFGQALLAGQTILNRVSGMNSQLSLTSVRHHGLDALDVVDVLLPQERYDIPRPVERHLIEKVTHPLMPTGTQTIETRATRPDTT